MRPARSRQATAVSTVADGRFSTSPLPADRSYLEVTATGYGTARSVIDHPGGRVRIRLAAVTRDGRVSAADLGPTDPFTAQVEVLDVQGRVVGTTRTQRNGTFRVVGLPSTGPLHLVVRADGYFVERRTLQQIASPVHVELLPAELAGRVVADANDEPVLDARAQLRTAEGDLVGPAVTDPQGRFLIPLAGLRPPLAASAATHRTYRATGSPPPNWSSRSTTPASVSWRCASSRHAVHPGSGSPSASARWP